jgi:hypothetical protein
LLEDLIVRYNKKLQVCRYLTRCIFLTYVFAQFSESVITGATADRAFPRPTDNSGGAVGTWKGGAQTGFSEGSTLDLTRFSPINLGTCKAPTACP